MKKILSILLILICTASYSQNSSFCYGNITVTLFENSSAVMTRKGSTGNIINRVIGKYEIFGKGNPTEVLQIKFNGSSYRYDLIRDGKRNPSIIIDNQGRSYNICSLTSNSSSNGSLTMPNLVAKLATVSKTSDYYLEKAKNGLYILKNKAAKTSILYVLPDDDFYDEKDINRLGFEKANNLIESFNSSEIKGWRLPTFYELQVLYNLKSQFEKKPASEMYWSTTISEQNPNSAFKCIDFTDGTIMDGLKVTSGRFGFGFSSRGYTIAVKDFNSQNVVIKPKITNKNNANFSESFKTKIFNETDFLFYQKDSLVHLIKPKYKTEGSYLGYAEYNKEKKYDHGIKWDNAPYGIYNVTVSFNMSPDGSVSNVKSFIEDQYFEKDIMYKSHLRNDKMDKSFLSSNPALIKIDKNGERYFSPDEINNIGYNYIKNEAIRLFNQSIEWKLWQPAYLDYFTFNKKFEINYLSTNEVKINFTYK